MILHQSLDVDAMIQKKPAKRHRGIYLLPNLFTTGELAAITQIWQRMAEDKLSVLYRRTAAANAQALLRRY